MNTETETIKKRLEYLRGEIRAERISYGEIAELQGLEEHIAPGDVELLEWTGTEENTQPSPARPMYLHRTHSTTEPQAGYTLREFRTMAECAKTLCDLIQAGRDAEYDGQSGGRFWVRVYKD